MIHNRLRTMLENTKPQRHEGTESRHKESMFARLRAFVPLWLCVFSSSIFLSAVLLFWFEPMVGKMMLPFLGGAASVWITCVLFFQLMLLTGYGYAHLLERYAKLRNQILVHFVMLLAVFIFLPVQFGARPDAAASAHPSSWLLWQL